MLTFQSTHPRGVRPESTTAFLSSGLFQSTHPRGVRRLGSPSMRRQVRVSIHAPARGATCQGLCALCVCARFNPRTREGCDGFRTCCLQPRPRFNPRTREGCDGLPFTDMGRKVLFQSTHPRGVRPDGGRKLCPACGVSIHAPARGATVLVICQGKSNSYLGVFENCPKRSSLKNHS